ncbi:FAD assembly factor SdhE [Perlucidibaca piscinae]|uniref:FAD assembly factor SdhE n=1 Tax=Perlucidibaca piscinae TaxID=392589 RepID=UPI0003B5BAAF|nr:succinate dehydrogenase assembly factor 2 [Perlucidibaca piscinae]
MSRPFTDAERRLRWQCRRGLKELDVLLEPFMEEHYRDVSAEEQDLFQRLLAEEDVDLLSWFMQYTVPDDAELERIVHVVLRRLAT